MSTEIIILLVLISLILVLQLIYFFTLPRVKKAIQRMRFRNTNSKNRGEFGKMTTSVEECLSGLSKYKIGAIVAFERKQSLEKFIEIGAPINADFSAELMFSIFEAKNSPLHDGGIIVQNDKIVCASAYFPNTSKIIDSRFGSRHRAAIGLSEDTDALVLIVSETDGSISYALDGKLITIRNDEVKKILEKELAH